MTLFWIILGLLTLFAVLFLITPLLRHSNKEPSPENRELNIRITKQHLAELDEDLKDGLIQQSEYESAKIDFERALLNDVESTSRSSSSSKAKPVLTAIIMGVILPLAAAALYWKTGTPELATYDPSNITQPQSKKETLPDIDQMIIGLSAKLQQNPDDAEGWNMLGKTYKVMDRFEEAISAYKQVLRLQPDNTDAMIGYADTFAMSQGGSLQGEPYKMVKRVLSIDPQKLEARWLAGIAESEMGNHQKAIDYWTSLQTEFSESRPEVAKELGEQISKARAMLTGTAMAEAPVKEVVKPAELAATEAETTTTKSIRVNITITEQMAVAAKPDDTVFIYAKAMQGPPMPLAAKKVTVKDLPLTLVLDDTMAMMPQMKLSLFNKVKVGARVSKSGQPTASAGDLAGEKSNIEPGQATDVDIVIDTQL